MTAAFTGIIYVYKNSHVFNSPPIVLENKNKITISVQNVNYNVHLVNDINFTMCQCIHTLDILITTFFSWCTQISPVNEFQPIWSSPTMAYNSTFVNITVFDGVALGSVVTVYNADDADKGQDGVISYVLKSVSTGERYSYCYFSISKTVIHSSHIIRNSMFFESS